MSDELKNQLDRIAAEPPHWTETKILNYEGGLVTEARKFLDPDWPRRDARTEILRLLNHAERALLGRARDGQEETEEEQRERRERAAEGHGPGKENVEVSVDSLAPDENESISDWLGRLGTRIDSNGHRKALWAGLRGYVSRFRGDAKARTTLDKKLVRRFLQHALG